MQYIDWKDQIKKEKRREERIYLRNLTMVFISLILIGAIFYYGFIGELQFVGHETTTTTAIVTHTQMHHIGKGKYLQTVIYEYEYNDKIYQGTFEASKLTGKKKIGDPIEIKISISDPNRKKRIKNIR